MSEEQDFRKLASCAMERAAAWRGDIDIPPSRPTASIAQLRARFAVGLPETGRDGVEVLEALADAAEPGLVGNIRSNFFAWVMGASHPVGVAADWMSSAWGQNAAIYETSPAAAVAEEVVVDWLLELMDLPRDSSVGFTTGATMASSICLAAARSEVLRRAGYDLEQEGVFAAPEIKVYLGEEAHATIFSGLRFLGFGAANIVRINVDLQGRMDPASLDAALAEYGGPRIVICQAGHINSGDFDPIAAITDIARRHGAWCHVDGAFGLWARAVPALAHLCAGAELADSWAVDAHKWLQVPYESAFAVVRDSDAHLRAMDISASYLKMVPGEGRSPSQYCPELSRRARGFTLWAVLQALGRQGIEEMVLRHCRCAQELQQLLAPEAGIDVLNEVVLNQLVIAFGEGREPMERGRMTDEMIRALAVENTSYVTGASWHGQKVMRVSVISQFTDTGDMRRLAASIIRAWHKVSTGQ